MSSPPFASSFVTKLGTNYTPSDEEIVRIQDLLVEPSSRLQRLEDQIADLHKVVVQLTEERDKLGGFVEAHKALLFPIRRLPLDVLQEIFVACIPTHRNCVMSACEAPVLLGRICSSWRAISLCTPRLWARLHIAEPTLPFHLLLFNIGSAQYEHKLAQRIEVTKTWLYRSGQCPLSVSVQTSAKDHGPPQIAPPPLPDSRLILALIPFAPRWQNMSLNAPWSTMETLFGLSELDVPMLKTFEMSQHHEVMVPTAQVASLRLLRGRNISSVTLQGVNIDPRDYPLHWDRLTTLSLMNNGWSHGFSLTSSVALEIFSRCPLLRTCRIVMGEDPLIGMELTQFVELQFLHSLHVVAGIFQTSTIRQMFGRLSLPELRDFDFRGRADSDGEFSFAALLATSTCLESLKIDLKIDTDTTKASFISLVRSLSPTVQHLCISDTIHMWANPALSIADDDLIALLTPSTEHPIASCPRLEELQITQGLCAFSDAALVRFITGRMTVEPSPTLKRVNVQFNREMQADIRPDIQPFLDAGLQVLTKYLKPEVGCSPWQGLPDAPMQP
ncbi:hypothetical protein FB451DRAFT_47903 [Mycena latifolia]|nr:hypothetical protein FB451DRAFT_47903 [Mycena latifolia]